VYRGLDRVYSKPHLEAMCTGDWTVSTLSLTWRYCVQETGQTDFASNVCDLQWNISVVDTIGTQLAVLYREVSLIQR